VEFLSREILQVFDEHAEAGAPAGITAAQSRHVDWDGNIVSAIDGVFRRCSSLARASSLAGPQAVADRAAE